jgi:hypothetical protein
MFLTTDIEIAANNQFVIEVKYERVLCAVSVQGTYQSEALGTT